MLLRNSALDFLKQPLVTVGRGLHVSYRDKTLSFIVYYIPDIHLMNSHISVAFVQPWILRQNAEVLNGITISPQHALHLCNISQLILSL